MLCRLERIVSSDYRAVVWIDHEEAQLIHFDGETTETQRFRHVDLRRYVYAIVGGVDEADVVEEPSFYRDVAESLADATEIVITGPSTTAKVEFLKHLHNQAPAILERIVGVETLGRVSDHLLLAEARRFFGRAWRPQLG